MSDRSDTPAGTGDDPAPVGVSRDATGAVDATTKRIIEQLQEDGRRSYAAIARAVGLSEAATRQRVQRLLDDGTVQIVAVADATALGFRRQAMLGLSVEGEIAPVADKLVAMDEAEYVVVSAGRFDLLAEVVCADDDHLLRTVDAVRMTPGVRGTETFIYLKLAKETYQWGTR